MRVAPRRVFVEDLMTVDLAVVRGQDSLIALFVDPCMITLLDSGRTIYEAWEILFQ